MKYDEHARQCAVIRWWDFAHKQFGIHDARLLYAVPNGGARNVITGGRLKREGVRSGIPDLQLDVARGEYHGLRIEMKTARGKVSASQDSFLGALIAQGYATAVCRSADSAIRTIQEYLGQDIARKVKGEAA